MKRLGIILTALLAFCCSSREQGCREMEGLVLQSSLLGRDVAYSVVLPADYFRQPSRSYPVLYLFHCIGGDSTTGIEYCDITHTLDSLVQAKAVEPMIVVMPDVFLSYCCDTFDGEFPYETMLLEELIPEVEKTWRTDGKRATIGFSMGGFGAMSVALRHPDLFCATAGLSPSVRTDEQYATEEPQEGWESQWGRIFGGLGMTGEERITPYYKERCPLHLFEDLPAETLSDMGIFIATGNREGGSLAESNEALHLALLGRGIPHVFSVSDGGHDFAFWRERLPDALRFLSCRMNGKSYSAKVTAEPLRSRNLPAPEKIGDARLYMPKIDFETTRKFPYICVFGASETQEKDIMEYYSAQLGCGGATPIAFLFIDNNYEAVLKNIEENAQQLRNSQRMRSAICFGQAAGELQGLMMKENLFTNVVFANASGTVPAEEFAEAIKMQKRYPKLILEGLADAESYPEQAALHVALKNAGIFHSHYARESGSGNLLRHFPKWIEAINYKFHD